MKSNKIIKFIVISLSLCGFIDMKAQTTSLQNGLVQLEQAIQSVQGKYEIMKQVKESSSVKNTPAEKNQDTMVEIVAVLSKRRAAAEAAKRK